MSLGTTPGRTAVLGELGVLLGTVGGLAAFAVVGLSLWTPIIKGHGIPESLETIVLRESRIRPRIVIAKPLSAGGIATEIGTFSPRRIRRLDEVRHGQGRCTNAASRGRSS